MKEQTALLLKKFVKSEAYPESLKEAESGSGKFASDGERIIVDHINKAREAFKVWYNSSMKRFYITGVSGVGKSSVALSLKKKGIPVIDIDNVKGLCHWVNKKTKKISYWRPGIGSEFLESHKYICDKNKLITLMNKHRDIVVVVGLADNQSDLFNLFDKVLFFYCDKKTFLRRINKRTNNDFGKHHSEQKMILNWYQEFKRKMLKRGAFPINTKEPLNVVVNKVIKYIKS